MFSGIFTFLVDAYPLYAASALAANSFTRSSFAAAFPLFGDQSRHCYAANASVMQCTLMGTCSVQPPGVSVGHLSPRVFYFGRGSFPVRRLGRFPVSKVQLTNSIGIYSSGMGKGYAGGVDMP